MKRKAFSVLVVFIAVFASGTAMLAQIPGEGWARIGVSYTGNITALAVSPNYETDQTLFIGVAGGGLWRSSTRGDSWRQCYEIPCEATVTGIALPRNYQYGTGIPAFAVTQEGNFYRSDDDFVTITYTYTFLDKLGMAPVPCTAIVVGGLSAFDGNIYVGTWGYGVWGNNSGGDPGPWQNISPSTLNLDYCRSLTITSEAAQKLWATSQSGGYSIYFYSGSMEWIQRTPAELLERDVLTIHASWLNPANMWVGTASNGMWRSTNGGTSWSAACDGNAGGGAAFEVRAIRDCPQVSTDNEIWEGRSDGLRTSTDLGVNCADGSPRSRVNVIGFAPAYHGTGNYCDAFIGTYEALYRVTCSAGTSNKGPVVVDGNAVALAFRGRGAFMGSLSQGLFKSVDNTTMVEYNNFPDKQKPQIVAICLHPLYDEFGTPCTAETTLFVGANFADSPSYNGVYKSVDAGNSWTKMTGGAWPSGAVVKDLAISPAFETDGTIFAAVNSSLFRWDGGTSYWTKVATDNNWSDITMVALPPGYDKNADCSAQGGFSCNTVFVAATESGSGISNTLYYSNNNGGWFMRIYPDGVCFMTPGSCPVDITGIAFPKNFGEGSPQNARVVASSSSKGILTSSDYEWYIWDTLNVGLPMNDTGGINVNDIAADPDWIDGSTPTEPTFNCAVAAGSVANPKDYGIYHTGNGGSVWTLIEPMSHALSVAYETPYPGESHSAVMAGYIRDAVPGYNSPPGGSFFSSDGGATFSQLTGYYSLPNDVFSCVAHERDHDIVFASSPSMGVFVSEDKGESFRPYNTGKGGADGPCYLKNAYGITMLAGRKASNLDAIYVGTEDGIKVRYTRYNSAGGTVILDQEDDLGTPGGWRHSYLAGGTTKTSGYWERLEVVPDTALAYPIWAVSPAKGGYPGQGFVSLPAGSFDGWYLQNSGLPSDPSSKGVRTGYDGGSSTVQPLYDGSVVEGSVQQGVWNFFTVDVPNGTKDLKVFLDDQDDSGVQDADLYLRKADFPSLADYDYRPWLNQDETVCATSIFFENFDGAWGPGGDNPPPGWTISDYGDEVDPTWNYNDWYRAENGSFGYSARVFYSPLENQNEWLVSPGFTIPSGMASAVLEFDHYFLHYNATGEYGYVSFRSNENPAWVNLATYTWDTGGMIHASLDLTPYIGNTNCQILFQYYAYNGWYWMVDNVRVTGFTSPRPQRLTGGTWYIGVYGYAATNNNYSLSTSFNTACAGSFSDPPAGTGKDQKYLNFIPPDPKAPVAGSVWGTVNGSGVYRGTGTVSIVESGPNPSAITWVQRNGSSPFNLTNLNTKVIIQLPDLTLITGCDASAASDKGIWYSPAGNEGQTTWYQSAAVAAEGSKNYIDAILAVNGDVLMAGSGTGTGGTAGGVWLSGDKGRNWMRISQGFNTSSQVLSDIVADSGTPASYYSSTEATGLWTRTITASPYPTITNINPTGGSQAGGTSVTITGTGFSNSCPTGTASDCPVSAPVVIFGSNDGTTAYEVAGTWSSPISLTAVSPPHAVGTVSVKVRNPDTRQTATGVAYTYSIVCSAPSGLPNNSAVDADACADTGVTVSWADPSDWGDAGSGTRTFDVLRDGGAISSGISSSVHSYTDISGTNGVSYTYSIRANNGCGMSAATTGASAADVLCVPPEVAQGSYPDIQSWSGASQVWPASERATGYYLYRMLKADLPNLQSSTEEGCKRDVGNFTTYDCSSDDPSAVAGRVYFYIVTGYNGTGEGSAGPGTGFTRDLTTSATCSP